MISVCLASYNGIKYIAEQLDSILMQIGDNDEIIISDDGSKDGTVELINEYINKHGNIKLIEGPRKGLIKNFENAINAAEGDIIFLSDQDDVWMPDKVSTVMKAFEDKGDKCILVLHDAEIVNAELEATGKSLYEFRGSRPGLLRCLIKNPYVGCCMAFRKELKKEALPFPDGIEMHDWWIALNAECGRRAVQIPQRLIKYRRHGDNASNMHHHPIKKMIHNRIVFTKELIKRRNPI